MKTLFLFEDEEGGHFFELDGDYSRLHDVYINAEMPEGLPHTLEQYEDLQMELEQMVYGDPDEEGNISGDLIPDELEAPTKDWDFFVRCGFVG